ncbi:MAG: hypothetical protein QXH91_01150 [Candidatus Bathyarchaeia archaeon]
MRTATMDIQASINKLREIEDKKDELITKVESFFNKRKEEGKEELPVERAQLQNLLRLALSTSSVKEIQLFIRYQIGRHKQWRTGDFGQTLENVIREIGRIEFVRLFLGYLVREARFRKPD